MGQNKIKETEFTKDFSESWEIIDSYFRNTPNYLSRVLVTSLGGPNWEKIKTG